MLLGVSQYYATGEGVTIYVASGNEQSIRNSIPEYFHPGLIILEASDWLKVANGDEICDGCQSAVNAIKVYLPILWKQIEAGACQIDVFMKFHFNQA